MSLSPGSRKVEALLRALPQGLRPVANALRRSIREVAPELTEDVKWNSPVWLGPRSGKIVVNLQVYDNHVNLGFWRGAELASAHPAIEGTGKSLRHVKIRSPGDASTAPVRKAIRAAVQLDRSDPPA
ncbi:MAG: DUF1801 domain-containing protein [Thermoplasmata archaeon]|nr:DUF1801 domain-containing protein [Thermoplasmata archaeon]